MSKLSDSATNAAELNVDNTMLNSINLEEFYIIRRSGLGPKQRLGLTLNKKAIAKSSSGFSSISSFGSFDFESEIADVTKEKVGPLKRPNETSYSGVEKKIKIDNDAIRQKIRELNVNQSGVGILQDTLDSINVTKLLESNVQEKPNLKGNQEFDAFAHYLNKNYSPTHVVKKQLFDDSDKENDEKVCQEKEVESLRQIVDAKSVKLVENPPNVCKEDDNRNNFSQSFSTQVIDQLETAIGSDKKKEISANCDPLEGSSKNIDDPFKMPLLKSFRKKSINETNLDQEITERCTLFEDENVTNQYRHQVDNLFEQIEHSIYAMGTEDSSRIVPDRILDIIFSDDVKTTEKESDNNSHIEWPENTLLNGVSLDASFGTVIKKALINNATKSVMPQKITNTQLNLSLAENKVKFNNLGPFYGLPLKVKELIKQYKGIDELYGWQDECLKLPAIENRKNLIYALPTSGGKTLVAEILMLRELMCYKRNAIFILPYVSIVQEKVWALSPFGVALDFLVEEYASCKGSYPPRKRRRKNSVYIATIEKALGIINSLIETGRLQEIGLIVVDELHLIGEEGRGATLEATLTKIMFLKANIQIVGMSATIGNLPDICNFLNADVYTQDFRPVELTEFVKCGKEIAKINWSYSDENDLLADPKRIDYKPMSEEGQSDSGSNFLPTSLRFSLDIG